MRARATTSRRATAPSDDRASVAANRCSSTSRGAIRPQSSRPRSSLPAAGDRRLRSTATGSSNPRPAALTAHRRRTSSAAVPATGGSRADRPRRPVLPDATSTGRRPDARRSRPADRRTRRSPPRRCRALRSDRSPGSTTRRRGRSTAVAGAPRRRARRRRRRGRRPHGCRSRSTDRRAAGHVRHDDMGVQVRVGARLIRWVNAAPIAPSAGSTARSSPLARRRTATARSVDVAERPVDGRVVRSHDLRGHRPDRPPRPAR